MMYLNKIVKKFSFISLFSWVLAWIKNVFSSLKLILKINSKGRIITLDRQKINIEVDKEDK